MTVVECFNKFCCVWHVCSHPDCGPAFLSKDLISYSHGRGIACSCTSVYNPRGNGQCERCDGIIWPLVKLALKPRGPLVGYFAMGTRTSACFALDPFSSVHCNQ